MRIVLMTVPHTGTKFFTALLEHHFPRVGPKDLIKGVHGFHPMHVSRPNIELLTEIRSPTVITTVRDREKVKRSWLARGKKLDTLEQAWREHDDLIRLWAPIVVSVDNDRERRLKDLGKRLGVTFETDWTPVGAWNHTEA